ncbi:hypothetical protein C8R47DRAFT_1193302, partial [Mycena vitilis]
MAGLCSIFRAKDGGDEQSERQGAIWIWAITGWFKTNQTLSTTVVCLVSFLWRLSPPASLKDSNRTHASGHRYLGFWRFLFEPETLMLKRDLGGSMFQSVDIAGLVGWLDLRLGRTLVFWTTSSTAQTCIWNNVQFAGKTGRRQFCTGEWMDAFRCNLPETKLAVRRKSSWEGEGIRRGPIAPEIARRRGGSGDKAASHYHQDSAAEDPSRHRWNSDKTGSYSNGGRAVWLALTGEPSIEMCFREHSFGPLLEIRRAMLESDRWEVWASGWM